jgi:phosphocarrier protein
MLRQKVTIRNKLGLHARAAAKLVNTVGRFESRVVLTNRDKRADAKSIMGVMMLAAGKGATIGIETMGSDADAALRSIQQLIADKFGEHE